MLHRQLLDRLLIAAAAIAVWAPALVAAEPARADAAQATVISPGGGQQALALDALAGGEDLVERTYVLRGNGESARTVTGFSLAALLEAAGADPYAFSYLEVLRPAGGAVPLSRHQALDPGAFPDGPPVVYATSSGTGFLRPSSAAGDLNAPDSFEAPQGVTIVLRKGSPLQVSARASTLRVRPGEIVEFSAEAEGGGAGERLAYSWYFDDGASASGPGASHSFARRGSYDVVVGVTAPGDETGASAVVTVQVGPPRGGPDRKGGGDRRDRRAPDHGAATAAEGGGAAPPGDAASGAPAPEASHRQPPEPRPKPTAATSQAPAGAHISGRLLSAPAAATSEPQGQPGARAGSPDGEESGGGGLPGAAVGLLIAAGLLGAGALGESRSLLS